jgi:hypothetical protein
MLAPALQAFGRDQNFDISFSSVMNEHSAALSGSKSFLELGIAYWMRYSWSKLLFCSLWQA